MKSKLILSILLSFTTLFASAHKSFISISNMEYNQKEKQIEVSLKLTAHDFEHILENNCVQISFLCALVTLSLFD